MNEITLLSYDHWRYICNEIGVFAMRPGQDWPLLADSPLVNKITSLTGGVEKVSHLISESTMDIFQRMKCKRNVNFLEIASDVNIHVYAIEKYLDGSGSYTLIHTDQRVVDWVNKKYIGFSAKVKAFNVSEFKKLTVEKANLIESMDCIFDPETFVIDIENAKCEIKADFRKICQLGRESGAVVYSLVPLVEYIPQEASQQANWTEGALQPFDADVIFSTLPINECSRVLFDDGRFKNYLRELGGGVREVSPPMKSLEWNSNHNSYCARVLY